MAKQIAAMDPVSAAMSAIESALNLTDDDEFAVATSENGAQFTPLAASKAITVTPVLKPSALAGETAPLLRPSPPPPASANESEIETDDRLEPAGQRRPRDGRRDPAGDERAPPRRTPFVLAVIASLAWATICALYGYQNLWPKVSAAPLRETLFVPRPPCSGWPR